MKKKLTALLCAMLIGCGALAESAVPTPTPAPEASEEAQTGGSMSVTLNGEALTLNFDPDPQYSICRDGYIQASFYAYGEGDLLYELYLTFPQDVLSGETLTPDNRMLAADVYSGVYLYVSTASTDVCSAATQYLTGAYPEGSSYALTFDSVAQNGSVSSFAGTLSAKLVEFDQSYTPTGTVNDFSATFGFSMDLSGGSALPEPRQPEASEAPSSPDAAPEDESPYPLPEGAYKQYPPTPPSQLVTPANAQRI